MFEVLKTLSELPDVKESVNWLECFKFALEQYGIENANNFLADKKSTENDKQELADKSLE